MSRLLKILTCNLALVTLAACSVAEERLVAGAEQAPSSAAIEQAPAGGAGNKPLAHDGVTFFHLNDTYRVGAVEDGNAGGFGRVVTLIQEAKREGREVRILHGGDFLYPSLESQLWDGKQMVDAFNYMDRIADMYVVGGNHEFDRRTPESLIAAVTMSEFDWIGDNYRFETGDADVDAALQSGFVFEAGGRRYGLFSLTLHPADGGNERDYLPTDSDYLGVARQAIEALDARGVDAIIGLTHLHVWTDEEIAAMKSEFPKLAFIVGGHEHEPEYRPGTATSAPVMKGASNAREIWRIDLSFDADRMPVVDGEQIVIDDSIQTDKGYAELELRWRRALLNRFPFLTAGIGFAGVPLDGREVKIRNEESNLGNFVVDQMRVAFGREPADLAFINSGTLRIDDYIIDDITFEDIARIFGFSSHLRYLTMTGGEFRDVLEAGYRGSGPSKGYFPQVSGFRVCVDRSLPEGRRIRSLQLPADGGWSEISDEQEYLVVVPDYLYGGGDGYQFPRDGRASLRGSELKYLVLDAILVAQAEGRKIGELVETGNRRIHILDDPAMACFE